MTTLAVAIVVLGIGLAVGLALASGLDVTGAIILGLVVAVGALGIAVARKSGERAVQPGRCPACDGLVSHNAPYCKHCGTDLTAD